MSGPAHGLTWDEYNEKFGDRIKNLENTVRLQRREIEKMVPDAQAGVHFKQLMKAVNENPLVLKEWNRFMMTLRMCGLDHANKESLDG